MKKRRRAQKRERSYLEAGSAVGVLSTEWIRRHSLLTRLGTRLVEIVMIWMVGLTWFLGHGLIGAALVIGLFWAALAHPERIRSPLEFRWSVICLGASILANLLIPLTLVVQPSELRSDDRGFFGTVFFTCGVPSTLLALAVLLAVDSVTARRVRASAAPNAG